MFNSFNSWMNSQDVLTACVLSATVALQALLGNSSAALMISCFWSRTSYLTFVCCVYAAIRRARLAHKKGQLSDADYEKEVNEYMTYAIKEQERIGVDVLVHGEPERSDM
jgi:ATP/maltotriose-dependent transcriptional regulator MalT